MTTVRSESDTAGRVLVTGAGGFVGGHLVEALAASGFDVAGATRDTIDLSDQAAFSHLCKLGIVTVVHAAGRVGGIAANIAAQADFFADNVVVGCAVVRGARAAGVRRLLNLSSSCAYPRDRERLREEDLMTGELEPTNEGYALAKLAVTRLCDWIAAEPDAPAYRTILPCNLYGPRDAFDERRGHLVARVVAKVAEAVETRRPAIEVWGDGTTRREFMHVRDLADAVRFLLPLLERLPQHLNVGVGADHTVDEYYLAASRVAGYRGSLEHDPSRPAGMRRKLLDTSRAAALGWRPRIALEDGLRETLDWYRSAAWNPLATSSWGAEEQAALDRVIASGRFTMGPEVRAFEELFAGWLGVRHCVMVNSGSSANLLMAAALRYRTGALVPGDEVIVPAVGWATTYYPFAQQGLRLRLVDVDPRTLNLDPAALAAAITPATRAVCLVHALGNPCDLAAISDVLARARARGQDICLLEDTCEALGAMYGDRPCGAHGAMGSFSFFFSHHISTMEGGMVATDDDELAEILTCLRAHGWTRDLPERTLLAGTKSPDPFVESFRFLLPGYNVRPLELAAAVGREQLAKLDRFTEVRRANAAAAREQLGRLGSWLGLQHETGASSWFGFSLLVAERCRVSRDEVVRTLAAAGVECRPVITGNFARQPVLRHLEHSIAGPLAGADAVHDRALFVGNAERDLRPEIGYLAEVLARIAPAEAAA